MEAVVKVKFKGQPGQIRHGDVPLQPGDVIEIPLVAGRHYCGLAEEGGHLGLLFEPAEGDRTAFLAAADDARKAEELATKEALEATWREEHAGQVLEIHPSGYPLEHPIEGAPVGPDGKVVTAPPASIEKAVPGPSTVIIPAAPAAAPPTVVSPVTPPAAPAAPATSSDKGD